MAVTISAVSGKKVGVFGLGKAGLGTLKSLTQSHAEIFAWDDKEDSRAQAAGFTHTTIAPFTEWPWHELAYLVLSPGVPFTHPQPHDVVLAAQKANVRVICDIELLYLACPQAHYIGITGTNGKSTTTALIGHILKESGRKTEVGGNIGIAATELNALGSDGFYVIETSSYQLDLIDQTHFTISVLLNITPDHIDRHGSLEGYTQAKERIYLRQTKNDIAVIGVDNDITRRIAEKMTKEKRVSVCPISVHQAQSTGVWVDNRYTIHWQGKSFALGALKRLPGAHNRENIAAAFAACAHAGVSPDEIIAAIHTFPGLPHRMELVTEKNGIVFINDSKATNAEAAEKALLSFENIYWIAGGVPKEGGIVALKVLFPKITQAYLIGQAAEEFASTLDDSVPYQHCGTLQKAVEMAYKDACKEKKPAIVLLSPACASFDQFKSYEDRGTQFANLARAIVNDAVA